MMHLSHALKNKYAQLVLMFFAKCASFFKMSFVVGSYTALFSASNCVTPLVGTFCGPLAASLFFLVRITLRIIMYKTVSLSILAFYVPGLCASLYCATRSSIIHCFLPILCMILFILHPVGGNAFVYSFFWFIPITLYFFPQRSFFWTALGSTFVAHAVGSVIWLYTVPMTAAMWLGLIPIVAVERLLFASAMVVLHHVIVVISKVVDQLQQQGLASDSAHVGTYL